MNKFTTSINGQISNSLETVMDLASILKVGKVSNYESVRDQLENSKRGILRLNELMAEDDVTLTNLVRDKEFSNAQEINAGNK